MSGGFFDFSEESPWGGSLEDIDCIFDDDALLEGEEETPFDEDANAAIDDQWSKLTTMYYDLTGDEDDERPLKPASISSVQRAVLPPIPSSVSYAAIFSPTKGPSQISSSSSSSSPSPGSSGSSSLNQRSAVEELWDSTPLTSDPKASAAAPPPGFDLGSMIPSNSKPIQVPAFPQSADQTAFSQQGEAASNSYESPAGISPSGSHPLANAISVDQLEQGLHSSAGYGLEVMTLDALESKLLGASAGPAVKKSQPPPDGQLVSLKDLQAQLGLPGTTAPTTGTSTAAPAPTTQAQFIPVPGFDSRNIVEEEDPQDGDSASQNRASHLPYYTRVAVDREYMTAAEMNYILKMQRVQLANLPNLYADDFYFQNYARQDHDGQGNSAESVLSVDHFPLCQLTPPPVAPKGPADFTGVLGKIPPGTLRGPREVLQIVSPKNIDTIQPLRPQQLPSQPILPRNQSAFLKYSPLMVLENALSLIIEVEDLDILLKTPNITPEKIRNLTLKRQTRTNRIFAMLRIEIPKSTNVPYANGGQFYYPEDSLFFMLLSRQKGRQVVARALSIFPIRETAYLMLILLRNWPHVMYLTTQSPDSSTKFLEGRLEAKIPTFPFALIAQLFHYCISIYQPITRFLMAPISFTILTSLLSQAKVFQSETATSSGTPPHWIEFYRMLSHLTYQVLCSLRVLTGDPKQTPNHVWNFLIELSNFVGGQQKKEFFQAVSSLVGSEPSPKAAELLQTLNRDI